MLHLKLWIMYQQLTIHTRECPSDTPKRSCNIIGDIGPMSLVTEADEEKKDELEFNLSNPNGGNSAIMHKIDLLLNQRKEDSKVISRDTILLKSADRGTDDSYCGRLATPSPNFDILECFYLLVYFVETAKLVFSYL